MRNLALLMNLDTLVSYRIFNQVQTFLIVTKKIDKPASHLLVYSNARNALEGHCKIRFVHDWTAPVKSQGIEFLNGYSHKHCLTGAEQYEIVNNAKKIFAIELLKPCFYAPKTTKSMIEAADFKVPRKKQFSFLNEADLNKLNIYFT